MYACRSRIRNLKSGRARLLPSARFARLAAEALSLSLLFFLLLIGGAWKLPPAALAQEPSWTLSRPSNSGIPGEEIRCLRFEPDGPLWVGARWPFWEEGGFGLLDRETGTWTVYANFESPIPSEYVNDIAFAPDGTAWIATNGGLVHRSGESWTVYTTANAPLLHNVIRGVEVDSRGIVWINNTNVQNQSAALFRFDGVDWQSFSVPNDIPWQDPWRQLDGLVVDRQDHVWIGNMTLGGVAEYDGQSWILRGPGMDILRPQTGDLEGGVWMISGHLGYVAYRWDGGNFIAFGGSTPPIQTTTITDITVDQGGTVYLGNWVGEVARTTDLGLHWTLFTVVSARVSGIAPDPGGTEVWIGSAGAVHRCSSAGLPLHVYNTYNTGVPYFWIDRFNLDSEGNLWMATGEAGLSRFDGQRWRNWGAHNAGSEPYPFAGNEPMGCFHEDAEGTGWMGGNGIARWDPQSGQFTGFWNWENNPGMGVGLWIYFAEDAAGHLFSAEKYGSIYRFDPELSQWTREPVQPYAALGLPGMASDSQGNVWVAGWFDLYKWDGASWSTTTLPDPNYFFDLGGINCMAVGPDDVFWLGTVEGAVRWDGSSFVLFDTGNSPLPANSVQGVDVDGNGRVGLSAADSQTASGVAVIDGDPSVPSNWTVLRYGQSPLPHWQLESVAFDAAGDLWISCLSMGAAVLRIGENPAGATDRAPGGSEGRAAVLSAAPNPFRSAAVIRYRLSREAPVDLAVYDVRGRLVRTLVRGARAAGEHEVFWNGTDASGGALGGGVFFLRLRGAGSETTSRLILTR